MPPAQESAQSFPDLVRTEIRIQADGIGRNRVPERGFKIPKFKIMKPPKLWETKVATLHDIGVLDSPPLCEPSIENTFVRRLHKTDYNKLECT